MSENNRVKRHIYFSFSSAFSSRFVLINLELASMQTQSKIIWITPKWPFPIVDGAKIATTQLLKNLSSRGVNIHLVSIIPEGEIVNYADAEKELGIKEVTVIRRSKVTFFRKCAQFLRSPFIPITFFPYAAKSIADSLNHLIDDERCTLVVYDGLHAAGWKLRTPKFKKNHRVEAYRAHNVESQLWFRASKETLNPFKKCLLYFQGRLIKRFEIKLARTADYVFPVSLLDASIFKKYLPRGKLLTLPIGLKTETALTHAYRLFPSTKRNILFVGKLDWAPNRDGLKWILDKVWLNAKERAKELSLTIVGSGDHIWLEPYSHLPGIKIIGEVQKLAPYYEDCIATIVPVFYGSGTRVKAIESSLYGRVCISTKTGVEGIGLIDGESYHRVEHADEWIHALAFLDAPDAFQMGKAAQDYAKRVFDPGIIADRFMESIAWSPGP